MEIYKNKNIFIGAVSTLLYFSAPKKISAQWDPGELLIFNLPDTPVIVIVENILNWLLLALSLVSIIGFIISGLLYLTAAGDSGQIDRAKNAMTYSIIGVIVGLVGFIVIQAAFLMLSGNSFF